MISFETKELWREGRCLVFRHWDGYDKPEYYKIFPISEEEMEFYGGRFERYHFTLDLRNTKKPVLIDYFHEKVDGSLEDIVNWIHEYTKDEWFMDVENGFSEFSFWFADDEDRFKFALTWK